MAWALKMLLKPFTVNTEDARAASEARSTTSEPYRFRMRNTDVIGLYDCTKGSVEFDGKDMKD